MSGWHTKSLDEVMMPKSDGVETAKSYQWHLKRPGVSKQQLAVNLSANKLIIKGEKRAEVESKEKSHPSVERSYGCYQPTFALPEHVDSSKITAQFRHGVLTVELPKSDRSAAVTRQIEYTYCARYKYC